MKNKQITASFTLLYTAIFLIVSCQSSTPGGKNGKPENVPGNSVRFSFVPPSFISLVPYKIDGKAHIDGDRRLMEGTMYSFTTLTTDWFLAPGRHGIEFYTVDTKPLKQFVVNVAVEAGKTYKLKGNSRGFKISDGANDVPFEITPVPVLVEPPEDKPHATLSFIPQKSSFAAVPYILRIDGKVRQDMYVLHPRWTTMNYSSLARGIVTAAGLTGMLIQPNLDVKEGYLSIRLEPGPHEIEYFCDGVFMGRKFFGRLVRIMNFKAEAGKSYLIEIVPDAAKSPEGVIENGARIVPEK